MNMTWNYYYLKDYVVIHSHSVVPGGLGVRSYRTRDIPGICSIAVTISRITYNDNRIQYTVIWEYFVRQKFHTNARVRKLI